MLRPIVPALLLASLSSCAVSPQRLEPSEVMERRRLALDEVTAAATAGEGFEPGDGLDRSELRLLMLVRDPAVRRARLVAEEALAAARAAGRLPDPTLSLEVLRLDFASDEPWFLASALEFALPFLSTRALEEAAAHAHERAALARLADAERGALLDAQLLWIAAWSDRKHSGLWSAHASALEDLARIADSLASVGEASPSAARRLRAAAIRQRLASAEASDELELRGLELAERVDWPAALVFALPLDLETPTASVARDELDPRVAAALFELAAAEEQLAAAARGAFDGATFGPAGEWEDGRARYGLRLGVPLPIFGRTAALRAVALVRRERAALELELAGVAVDGSRRRAQAELAAAERARARIESEWLPLAESEWNTARELFRLGELAADELEDALDILFEARAANVSALAREAAARARTSAIGTTVIDEQRDERTKS